LRRRGVAGAKTHENIAHSRETGVVTFASQWRTGTLQGRNHSTLDSVGIEEKNHFKEGGKRTEVRGVDLSLFSNILCHMIYKLQDI